jgi:apolipoprotein N-acyltransferase
LPSRAGLSTSVNVSAVHPSTTNQTKFHQTKFRQTIQLNLGKRRMRLGCEVF